MCVCARQNVVHHFYGLYIRIHCIYVDSVVTIEVSARSSNNGLLFSQYTHIRHMALSLGEMTYTNDVADGANVFKRPN